MELNKLNNMIYAVSQMKQEWIYIVVYVKNSLLYTNFNISVWFDYYPNNSACRVKGKKIMYSYISTGFQKMQNRMVTR